jgi:hypothetical protein
MFFTDAPVDAPVKSGGTVICPAVVQVIALTVQIGWDAVQLVLVLLVEVFFTLQTSSKLIKPISARLCQ